MADDVSISLIDEKMSTSDDVIANDETDECHMTTGQTRQEIVTDAGTSSDVLEGVINKDGLQTSTSAACSPTESDCELAAKLHRDDSDRKMPTENIILDPETENLETDNHIESEPENILNSVGVGAESRCYIVDSATSVCEDSIPNFNEDSSSQSCVDEFETDATVTKSIAIVTKSERLSTEILQNAESNEVAVTLSEISLGCESENVAVAISAVCSSDSGSSMYSDSITTESSSSDNISRCIDDHLEPVVPSIDSELPSSELEDGRRSSDLPRSSGNQQCAECEHLCAINREQKHQLDRLREELTNCSDDLNSARLERDEFSARLTEMETGATTRNGILETKTAEFEKLIEKRDAEIRDWKTRLESHDAAAKKTVLSLQSELTSRNSQLARVREDSQKEQGSLVVQYAQAEQRNIELADRLSRCESVARDAMHERELSSGRLRAACNEKHALLQALKAKGAEVASAKRDFERIREQCSSGDVTLKWTQNKLKAEVDAHKETKQKLDDTVSKLNQAKEETEQIRKDCQAMIMTYQVSEEIKSNSLDIQLKSKVEELQLQKQEQTDKEEMHVVIKKELHALKLKHKEMLDELQLAKDKVSCLDDERLSQETTLARYGDTLQGQKHDNEQLRQQLNALTDIETLLNREKESSCDLQNRLDALQQVNRDLESTMRDCNGRESEHLEFTRCISDKNARLQSDHITLTNKLSTLQTEHDGLQVRFTDCQQHVQRLMLELESEKGGRSEEHEAFTAQLMQKTKQAEELSTSLTDRMDELKTQKRKHGANMKDLLRQLQLAKRRQETYESRHGDRDSVGMGSRTSSNGSLGDAPPVSQAPPTSNHRPVNQEPATPISHEEMQPIVEVIEIDKQMLLDKIIRLQRSQARKSEKMEFMEDHINRLLQELQAKAKIISNYVMREESGSLAPEIMDISKSASSLSAEQKAELVRKGGIMASVYSSQSQDGTMTMGLSLEINRKLQSVLEDTLLKNIMLKENIDTLGEEIARLSRENRTIQLKLQGSAQQC